MKSKIALVFVGILIAVISCNAQSIEPLLKNRVFVEKQIECILGSLICDGTGIMIKRMLNTVCADCSSFERNVARTLTKFMQERHPLEWAEIIQKYELTAAKIEALTGEQ